MSQIPGYNPAPYILSSGGLTIGSGIPLQSWGPLLSGSIASGQIGTLHAASDGLVSGPVNPSYFVPEPLKCYSCQKPIESALDQVIVTSGYTSTRWFCHKCASFDKAIGTFLRWEDHVRDVLQLSQDAPLEAVADVCEELRLYGTARSIRDLIKP